MNTNDLSYRMTEGSQGGVSGLVTTLVVNLLEVIDIKQEQAPLPAEAHKPVDLRFESWLARASRERASQAV